jgi:hypothetical protein
MSRAGLVAMLVAVEVLIVGIAIYVMGGGGIGTMHGATVFAGMHRIDFAAKPIAPIGAGDSPHVSIDDPNSRVEVSPSHDGQVHVKDLTSYRGATYSKSPLEQLTVERTADGVHVVRPGSPGNVWDMFGYYDQRIEIDAPAGSHIDIARCSGADVTGIDGGVTVRSQDGHITLTSLTGAVDAFSGDGYIEANNVHGETISLRSHDGHVGLQDVAATTTLTAHSDDGRIYGENVGVGHDGNITTSDGSIVLGLAPGADLTVNASTGDGSITVDGTRVRDESGDSVQQTVRVGNGSGSLRVSSNDGSIHITTNGAQ